MLTQDMNRREILKSLVGMTAALMVPGAVLGQTTAPAGPARDRLGELLPQRKLGKTGAMVTMLGLGGSHVGRPSEAEAEKMIETAIAGGVRFFDTAVVYQNGGSEERYGKFLTPKYRDIIFLMTKSRTQEPAKTKKDLDDSLRRMKTDYIDLWQMHENTSVDDVNMRLDNGVLEVLLDAKAKGKVKHIGFTGHTTPDAHLRMIERVKAEKKSVLETCQMPINVADPSYNSFILQVLPKLVEEGYGVLAMKTLSGGAITGGRGGTGGIVPSKVTLADALHFVWSLPVSCLISGPNSAAQYQETINIAKSFKMLDEKRRQEIIAAAAPMAGKGVENYKT
jgi:aryl-alcohol dehydrogenase-like predicted oxidoreductase